MRPLPIARLTLMDNYILITISAMALAALVFVIIEVIQPSDDVTRIIIVTLSAVITEVHYCPFLGEFLDWQAESKSDSSSDLYDH